MVKASIAISYTSFAALKTAVLAETIIWYIRETISTCCRSTVSEAMASGWDMLC